MKKLFTIGEISNLYGINYRTLRYYDDIGLLKPECINSENNYRYYSTKQFEHLNTILYLRELDIPVNKIKEFFDNKDVNVILEVLSQQKEKVADQKSRLELIGKKIENRINHILDAINSEVETIEERVFDSRKIAFLNKRISLDDDVEYPLREIGGKNPKNSVVFLGKVGLLVNKKDLQANNFNIYSGIFIFLEKEDEYDGDIEIIPANKYLTLRFRGVHGDSEEYYKRLFDYMAERNYEIAGDALEISLIDYCLTNDIKKYITEIQIPYK